jgi:hypothetical protein
VAKANVTARWVPHALFNHEVHQMLSCTSCHARVTESELTDVLVPEIRTCQQCHREDRKGAAEARCFECHVYHDWSRQKLAPGRFTIPELEGKAAGRANRPDRDVPVGLANVDSAGAGVRSVIFGLDAG